MEDSYAAIATFDGVDFYVGAYSVRTRKQTSVEDQTKTYARQDIEVLFRRWMLSIPAYALRVIPQAEMDEMPFLLSQANNYFKGL